jgi:hypothetical protein
MANRNFSTNGLSLEKKTVTLWLRVAIGATGAPTLQAWNAASKSWVSAPTGGWAGVKSITRNSAGKYTIVLQDKYTKILAAWVGFICDAAPAAGSTHAFSTGTDPTTAGGGTVIVQCRNNSGTATDPASGEVMTVEIELGDSDAV